MKRITFARLAVLLLAAVSLALSGCGGDDGVDQSLYDMTTAELDDTQAALAAVQAAADAAAAQAATALAAAQQAQADAINAQTAAEAARDEARTGEADAAMRAAAAEMAASDAVAAAEAAAMSAQQAADALMQAQADLEAAMMMQTEAEGDLDDAQAQLNAAAVRNMARRAAILITELNAIQSHMGMDNTDDPQGDSPDFSQRAAVPVAQTGQLIDDVYPGQSDNYMDAPGQRGGLGFVNTMADGVAIDTINDEPVEFQEYEVAESMPPAIMDWDGVVLERRNDADIATQTLYAYTDIATAGTTTFLEKYIASLNQGKLEMITDLTLAESASFPTRTEDNVDFVNDGPSFLGTYDSVEGEFQCTGGLAGTAGCMVFANDGTGKLTLERGDNVSDDDAASFTFTPNDVDATIGAPDGEYVYFGYWLHKPDDAGGDHGFGLVYGGSDMFDVYEPTPDALTPAIRSAVTSLAGEARFEGPAAGKYVTRDLNENTADIGVFTATAEMLASFGTDMEEGKVDGVIKDFGGGAPMNNNWRVTLGDASLEQIGSDESTVEDAPPGMNLLGYSTTQFTGAATLGGTVTVAGDWVGTFYGNGRADDKPGSIAGAFEVMSPHVAIAGTFGADNNE